MHPHEIEYNRGAVRPVQCMREGWQLIKENYWLFFGLTFVGMFIAGFFPLILMGPILCGLYLCFMRHEEGEPVSFNVLFEGFNFLGQGVIAVLLMMVPTLVIIAGISVLFCSGFFALIAAQGQQPRGAPPDGAFLGSLIALYVGYYVAIIVASGVVHGVFIFAFPLIAEKGLSGYEAVMLSFRAALRNLGGIFLLILLTQLLSLVGFLFCFVGAYLEMPLHFAMTWIAYRQVFPRRDPLAQFRVIDDQEERGPSSTISDTSVTADRANP